MKKTLLSSAVIAFIALAVVSCKKNNDAPVNTNELSAAEVSMIKAAGLQPTGAIRLNNKYLIEGDILLTADELRSLSSDNGPNLIVANSEQYRTTKLVKHLPRTIKIGYSGTHSSIATALANAVARYNARGLQISFQQLTSGTVDIIIVDVSGQVYIASSGFPSKGDPYNTILFNVDYANWSSNTLTTVLAHEIGHCIGFRHTDYMDRSYSCGGAPVNEGDAGIGAIHINGTPTGPDPNSWMLACLSNGVNRPFNANDKKALKFVY
ncbi:MAG TPA: M57 family metalloprotease [Chitinophagaceae bacterium]|jgi:hypothetical protein